VKAVRTPGLLRWTVLSALVLGVAGCAPPLLLPAVIEHTLDGWAFLTTDTAGVRVFAGSSSARLCEDVRRALVRLDQPFPVRCQYVRLDMSSSSPNLHVAVGAQPQDGTLVFIGGPTPGDCERLRARVPRYHWSEVPCRPALLIER
jgi:hypothetical protein